MTQLEEAILQQQYRAQGRRCFTCTNLVPFGRGVTIIVRNPLRSQFHCFECERALYPTEHATPEPETQH